MSTFIYIFISKMHELVVTVQEFKLSGKTELSIKKIHFFKGNHQIVLNMVPITERFSGTNKTFYTLRNSNLISRHVSIDLGLFNKLYVTIENIATCVM